MFDWFKMLDHNLNVICGGATNYNGVTPTYDDIINSFRSSTKMLLV